MFQFPARANCEVDFKIDFKYILIQNDSSLLVYYSKKKETYYILYFSSTENSKIDYDFNLQIWSFMYLYEINSIYFL